MRYSSVDGERCDLSLLLTADDFTMKLRLVHLMIFATLLTIAYAGSVPDEDDHDYDPDKDGEESLKKTKHDYVPRYRRPLDLRIRVPFFKMFLKRDKTGPSKLDLQVFPDPHGSLVDLNHQWWRK
ncbi:hypothetical protein NPIL_548241 [Nephila pilipes]|uniref:Uncharacterized protein n=1 Tax=Nephila pilipes TaxID=299642 RepID=A0A8X6PU73_NEPPI|nr:hypothetical protein NPIL_548241 [Nephila pilipes]